MSAPEATRCAWCRAEIAPGDGRPILYARLPGVPDEQNMQCADNDACAMRQDALDAALITRSPGSMRWSRRRITPGVQAALADGDRLREGLENLEAGHG
jgi:hypothetical protein